MFDSYFAYIVNNPISSIAVFVTVLPLTLTIVRRAFLDQSLRLLFCYLVAKFIIDLAMLHFAANRTNNIIFYNLSIPLFYALLGGMFYFKFAERPQKRFLIASMIGLFFFVPGIWSTQTKIFITCGNTGLCYIPKPLKAF